MGRLFLKLYSIIAIASIVFFIGVANLESIILGPRENHAADLSQGTYFLMEQEIDDTPKSQWPTILARVNQGNGYPVEILPVDSLSFSPSTLRKLERGKIVLFDVYDAVYSFKQITNSEFVLQFPFEQSGYQHEQRLISSTFNLIEQVFHENPSDEWIAILDTLNLKFTFPIKLVKQDDVKILINESQRLAAREVVFVETADDSRLFFRKISDSPYILRLGPFKDSVTLENLMLYLMLIFSTLVALAVFIWACIGQPISWEHG